MSPFCGNSKIFITFPRPDIAWSSIRFTREASGLIPIVQQETMPSKQSTMGER